MIHTAMTPQSVIGYSRANFSLTSAPSSLSNQTPLPPELWDRIPLWRRRKGLLGSV